MCATSPTLDIVACISVCSSYSLSALCTRQSNILVANMGAEMPDLARLRVFQRQYFQLVEPSQLSWPQESVLKSAHVQSWMFANLFDLARIKSPPPERYQLRVLKLLITKLERSIIDPEEDVWFPFPSVRLASGRHAVYLFYRTFSVDANTMLQGTSLLHFRPLTLSLVTARKSQMISCLQCPRFSSPTYPPRPTPLSKRCS
jgi:hypothetical protein